MGLFDVEAKVVDKVFCMLCGRIDEGVQFDVTVLWIFHIRYGVCEGCISRLFRQFRRSK